MEDLFFLGMMVGSAVTMAVQWYGRRKVRQAIAAPDREARRSIELLDAQNDRQVAQIDRLQERIATLERITTDSGFETARQIDALGGRDPQRVRT